MELEKGAQELGRGVAVDVEDLDDARVLDGHGCGEPSEAIGRRPGGKRTSRLLFLRSAPSKPNLSQPPGAEPPTVDVLGVAPRARLGTPDAAGLAEDDAAGAVQPRAGKDLGYAREVETGVS